MSSRILFSWYLLTPLLSVVTLFLVLFDTIRTIPFTLRWCNLIHLSFLFLHQTEEYIYPGTFPKEILAGIFFSKKRLSNGDHWAIFVINVIAGWGGFLLAAIVDTRCVLFALWPTALDLGNAFGHTFVFNILTSKRTGRVQIYNAGMFTSIFLFAPIIVLTIRSLRFVPEEDLWILRNPFAVAVAVVLMTFCCAVLMQFTFALFNRICPSDDGDDE